MAFNSFHYLLLLIALPIGVYFFFTELSSNMRNQLRLVSADQPNDIAPSWNSTQTEVSTFFRNAIKMTKEIIIVCHFCRVQRKCCGFHNRTDWFMAEYSDDDDDVLMADQEIYYPTSCCNLSMIHVTYLITIF